MCVCPFYVFIVRLADSHWQRGTLLSVIISIIPYRTDTFNASVYYICKSFTLIMINSSIIATLTGRTAAGISYRISTGHLIAYFAITLNTSIL